MVLVVLATVPVIGSIGRLAKDERLGRLDLLLLKTSRAKLLWSTWCLAVLVGIIVAEPGGLALSGSHHCHGTPQSHLPPS